MLPLPESRLASLDNMAGGREGAKQVRVVEGISPFFIEISIPLRVLFMSPG
jgi:hypothetical protein